MGVSGAPAPTDVFADRISFHRAMGNLLSNAVRYAKSSVQIHIDRSKEMADSKDPKSLAKDMLCIEFEDDGPGIPEDKRVAILAPFVRLASPPSLSAKTINRSEQTRIEENTLDLDADVDASNSHAGLGLGLAIVDRILKQHGGSVRIEQVKLGGCLVRTFWPMPSRDPDG